MDITGQVLGKMQEQVILGLLGSSWSATIGPFKKRNGEIRGCGDFYNLSNNTEVNYYYLSK